MSFAAVAAWILAGGNQVGLPAPLSDWLPPTTPIDAGVEGSAPVHVESTPSGAEVRIDGIRRGQTPASLGLSPGSHVLTLRHPNAIGAVRSIDVPAEGTDLTVSLWRRQPDILPLRPVYPGANLVDARFLADGTVALSVSLPGGSSAAQPHLHASSGSSIQSPAAWPDSRSPIPRLSVRPWSHSLPTANRWPTLSRVPRASRPASGPPPVARPSAAQRAGRRRSG